MLVMRKKYSEAVDALERAVELMPHVAKYRAMLKTARRDGAGGDGSFEI